jgi:hypothetical protein
MGPVPLSATAGRVRAYLALGVAGALAPALLALLPPVLAVVVAFLVAVYAARRMVPHRIAASTADHPKRSC